MTAPAPQVSIVLPTYNHLAFLPQAVAAALAQTRDGFELVIVNDGSTDGTREWLDRLDDDRVRVIHQENRGVADALNTGVRAARGEYLSWMSADNRCAPYFVEALAAALDADPESALAYSPFYVIGEDDRTSGLVFDNILLLRELVTLQPRGLAGFMYRKRIHDTVGGYEGWACDTLMWARILAKHSAVFVLEPTYYFRFHRNRATVTRGTDVAADAETIPSQFLAQHAGRWDAGILTRLYPGLAREPQRATYAKSDFAARLARVGRKREAAALLAEALRAAAPGDLIRPVVNAVAVSLLLDEDSVVFVSEALAQNQALPPESVEAAIDLANAVQMLAAASGSIDYLRLEFNNLLVALEKPKVFSYTAWKTDPTIVPVVGTYPTSG